MAGYKVSYKVLSEQGTTLKNIAKQIDSYTTRINAVRGKLGDDQLLQETRNNLQKLAQQMEENRTVINMASDVVLKCVEAYAGTEKETVKKVDAAKAHNRDFYKNPVVVASAGGNSMSMSANMNVSGAGGMTTGAAGAGMAGATNANIDSTVESNMVFVDQSTTVNGDINMAGEAVPEMAADQSNPSVYQLDFSTGEGVSAAAATGLGVAGAAAGVAAVYGGSKLAAYLKEKNKKEQDGNSDRPEEAKYKDAEARLAEAREKLANLSVKGEE